MPGLLPEYILPLNDLSYGGRQILNLLIPFSHVDDITELFEADLSILVGIDGPHGFVHDLLELRFLQVVAHHGTQDLSVTLLESNQG